MSPFYPERYPDNWDAISKRIRFERANNRCEECGVENGAFIIRSTVDSVRYIVVDTEAGGFRWPDGTPIRLSEIPDEYPCESKWTRVILTCAHLNHDTTCNDDSNLRAWCQRCHNRYDMPMRQRHAAETRLQKRDKAIETQGQMSLFEAVNNGQE